MAGSARITLVVGGARSGKSRYAESLIATLPPPWTYVATATAGDAEMAERIARHRDRRGPDWRTIEVESTLDRVITEGKSDAMLVDCLTLWLSRVLMEDRSTDDEIARLEKALSVSTAPKILVSNEVGSGIVPNHPLGRRFRDAQGFCNQRIAALADRVVLVVAGLPLALKGTL